MYTTFMALVSDVHPKNKIAQKYFVKIKNVYISAAIIKVNVADMCVCATYTHTHTFYPTLVFWI